MICASLHCGEIVTEEEANWRWGDPRHDVCASPEGDEEDED